MKRLLSALASGTLLTTLGSLAMAQEAREAPAAPPADAATPPADAAPPAADAPPAPADASADAPAATAPATAAPSEGGSTSAAVPPADGTAAPAATAEAAPPEASPAAEGEEDLGSLMEVLEENVVSGASRSAERASDAPAASTTITPDQMKALGIYRLEDAINYLSLGMFAHDRMSTSEVGARGVALTKDFNSHVLVVLDGMVMNEQGGGAVFMHDVPMENIDHIEVILGPGSVLYGAQAMLGVINVVTRAPADSRGVTAQTYAGVSPPQNPNGSFDTPYASTLGHELYLSVRGGDTFNIGDTPVGLVLSGNISEFTGPRIAFEEQATPVAADGSTWDLGAHARDGYWGGTVNEQWFRKTAGGYARFLAGNLSGNFRASRTRIAAPQMDLFESRAPAIYDDPYNANKYTLLLANLKYDVRASEKLTGFARGYFGYSKNAFHRYVIGHDSVTATSLGVVDPEQCPAGPLGPCRKEMNMLSRWTGAEVQGVYDWLGDGAYPTMMGVDGRLRTAAYEFVTFDVDSGKSYGSDPAQTRWHAGGSQQDDEYAFGAYLQQTAQPWSFLRFNAGVRVDLDTRIDSEYLTDAISPRAAIITTPVENVDVKLIYSKAFRAPSFLELHTVNGRLLPNPDGLQPETVHSFELMGTLRHDVYKFSVGGFYADWQNLIQLQIVNAQAPSTSRYANVEGVINYGGSVSAEGSAFARALRWGLNGMVTSSQRRLTTQQQNRNDYEEDTVPLTVAPQLYGNGRASYNFGNQTIALAAGYFGTRIADQAYYGGDESNLTPRPEASPELALRGAFTGKLWQSDLVGYTLGGNYIFGHEEPYVVGPNQGMPAYLVSTPVKPQLAQQNRFTLFAGLEVSFDPEKVTEPSQE